MKTLKLQHGPKLTYISYPMKNEVDVTKYAHQFLYEDVDLDENITVLDIFKLLEADPILVSVFRRDFAEDYLKAALSSKFKKSDLEYIELYKEDSLNTSTNEFSSGPLYSVHALSYVLKKDNKECHVKKGNRINYGISFSPMNKLIDLKIKVRELVNVSEDDIDSSNYYKNINSYNVKSITLGTLIHSLLWELSFNGPPEKAEKEFKGLKKQVKKLKAGKLKTTSADDLFDDLDKPGIKLMFKDIGSHKIRDISSAMRNIDDQKNMYDELQITFGDTVTIKDKYKTLNAHDFRKTFREAKIGKRLKLKKS